MRQLLEMAVGAYALNASGGFCWTLSYNCHWPECGQTFLDLAFQIVHFVEVNMDSSKLKAVPCSLCIWKVMFCSKA